MKIAFITSGTITSSLSSRPLALGKALQKRGHNVSIYAPRLDKYSQFIDEKISEIDGVTIMRPFQARTSFFEIGLIPYIASSIISLEKLRPDIIHVSKSNPVTRSEERRVGKE